MTTDVWLQLTWQQLKATGLWSWVATLFGVAEVLLARRNSIWLYPAGIAGILAGTYVLIREAGLYAEALLNGYYLVMSVYGWYHWAKKAGKLRVDVTASNAFDWAIALAIALVGWGVLYVWLAGWTDSTVPFWDAFVASSAWAGMWLLARRKLENWILLNVSNLVAIPLLFYKQLPMFALLTVFFFVVAVFGYLDWRRIVRARAVEPRVVRHEAPS